MVMKKKNKVRYISPRVLGTGTMLSDLLCASVLVNVEVQELDNINRKTGNAEEPLYFEF